MRVVEVHEGSRHLTVIGCVFAFPRQQGERQFILGQLLGPFPGLQEAIQVPGGLHVIVDPPAPLLSLDLAKSGSPNFHVLIGQFIDDTQKTVGRYSVS